MRTKSRLSASVDSDVLRAARDAVKQGRAESVSAWVTEALRRHAEHERRMTALAQFVDAFEAEHGEISAAEVKDARRRLRARAVAVRGDASGGARTS